MKTLEELKQEMDDARAAAWDAWWTAAWDAAWAAARDAEYVYRKRLKELKEDLREEDKRLKEWE